MEIISVTKSAPKFSIITVCFNAMAVIPKTLESLRAQSFTDYEWVVVDGDSSDGTKVWLEQQSPDIYVSERDRGIFDAMNKAVDNATGEWLFFLNAGDEFADSLVLADIATAIDAVASQPKPSALVYGDVVYFGTKGQRRKRFHWMTRNRLVFGDLCHQSAFVQRRLFRKYGDFDITLRFNADFDWFIRIFKSPEPLLYIARDIALFHDAGAHVIHHASCEAERDRVRARYCYRPLWLLGHWALRVELKLRRLLGETT